MRLKNIVLVAVFTALFSITSFASGWEMYQSGEWVYHNSDNSLKTSEWVESNGQWYYLGPDSVMLKENYTPDGYWVNSQGVYEPQWGQRWDGVSPMAGRVYSDTYSYTFTKDVYADGNEHWQMKETIPWLSNSYEWKLDLYPMSGFSYDVMDVASGTSVGYVSFSPDGRVAYISMGGTPQRCTVQ